MNRLSIEKSAYLKHSAHQKINWYPWSEEAFERAKEEDKPVFLSSGAIWCHWCHVMAKECFENEDIVKLLNEDFISIKLDRDERPEIDRRYQQAIAAMGSGGGWPLSIFLTHDKKPFFGGTYFPPEDMQNRSGFKKVLRSVAEFYRARKAEVFEYTDQLIEFLKIKPMIQEDINESLLDVAVSEILSEFDPQNGGFGTSPKFHMPGAMEFLINRYFLTKSESIKHVVQRTLDSMAKGGFHDQLGGGFHRYSTDEAWIIPHFEKLADDNAWLLRNYIDACSVFGDEYFKETAAGIIHFIRDLLSDHKGGFYASQDADVTPDDEGGYFLWTDEDFRGALNGDEYQILSMHFLSDRGSMSHDRSKKVLFAAMEPEEIAQKMGKDLETVLEVIKTGKEKLLNERVKRKTPFIDKTFYTSLNGMMITSYLKAYKILKDKYLKDFALKTLDKIMGIRFVNGALFHSEGVDAVLDDYIYIIEALISAYEITGSLLYINKADEIMEICINRLWDKNEGGFFDTDKEILGIKLKGIEDIPHPSANSLATLMLLKLHFATNKDVYRQYAETALRIFASKARDMGIHTGYYFCALDSYFNMLKLTLETLPEGELANTVFTCFYPYVCMVYAEDKGRIIPCILSACYEPIYSSDKLRNFIDIMLKHDRI